ncbi:MAG: relaxase/mobilization nuclease domain-containing protein [Prevotella sp.]|nr:relaxase/mobilization nuclease domain-containing protein [Prevotella sp.]
MIAKADTITHGSNAVRYSADKELAEIVKVGHLPEGLTTSSIWSRMMLHQAQFREKQRGHRRIKNTSIRIELSPAPEETEEWTMADWQKLADDFIREFDAVSLKRRDRDEDEHTHLANSQYVVSLHHDSKGKILHLHINANRIDMEGNTNNEYMIGKRATMAANKINEQRGWIQSMTKREWNIDEITNACIDALKSMDSFDFNTYEVKLRAKGYGVKVMRDGIGKVCGYSVKKGNSTYKSSELGHSRSLTPSRLRTTWEKLHRDKSIHTQMLDPKGTQSVSRPVTSAIAKVSQPKQQSSPKQMPLHSTTTSEPVKQPVMVHHDIDVDGKHYLVDIPEKINDILMKEATLPDDVLWSRLADVQNTALLLFANYVDAATQMSESCGGGGSSAMESGWGRKEDEDDMAWARRCAQQAFGMHKRRSRGVHR